MQVGMDQEHLQREGSTSIVQVHDHKFVPMSVDMAVLYPVLITQFFKLDTDIIVTLLRYWVNIKGLPTWAYGKDLSQALVVNLIYKMQNDRLPPGSQAINSWPNYG